MEAGINVVIVEDTDVIRESLSILIQGTSGFNLTGIFSSAEEALIQIPLHCPDVVLMDIGLPGISGIECIKQLFGKCPEVQFLINTIFEDDDNVFEALKAGATGYILKNTKPAQLMEAITDLHNGGAPMSPQIARKVINAMHVNKVSNEMSLLSSREIEVLQLLSKGFRYKEIADQLNISHGTVRTHIRNIYEKLQVQSRTDALNKVYPR